MYELLPPSPFNQQISCVRNIYTHIYVPFATDNTDYQQFKTDLINGVPLNDSTGNAMTAEQITIFLQTLKD